MRGGCSGKEGREERDTSPPGGRAAPQRSLGVPAVTRDFSPRGTGSTGRAEPRALGAPWMVPRSPGPGRARSPCGAGTRSQRGAAGPGRGRCLPGPRRFSRSKRAQHRLPRRLLRLSQHAKVPGGAAEPGAAQGGTCGASREPDRTVPGAGRALSAGSGAVMSRQEGEEDGEEGAARCDRAHHTPGPGGSGGTRGRSGPPGPGTEPVPGERRCFSTCGRRTARLRRVPEHPRGSPAGAPRGASLPRLSRKANRDIWDSIINPPSLLLHRFNLFWVLNK